jgi:NADH:ubiquinone oxidoreductase subunit K
VLSSLPEQIWAVAMLAVSSYAWWRGGWVERVVAVANVLAWIATVALQNRTNWVDPQWSVFAVDVMFLGVLLALVVRSDRNWILPAAAFQLLLVITHAAIIVDGGVRARAYITALILWSYLVLITLALGAHLRWRLSVGASARPAR